MASVKSISEVIDFFARNSGTQTAYRSGLLTFFEFINPKLKREKTKVSDEELAEFDRFSVQYIEKGNPETFFDDILKFVSSYKAPPKTVKQKKAAILQFFRLNNIFFNPNQMLLIKNRMPRGGAQTIEDVLDHIKLRTILDHAPLKVKALVLWLCGTGMRLGEALSITMDYIHLDAKPCAWGTLKGQWTKNSHQRDFLISSEAVFVVNEWLKVKEQYIKEAEKKTKNLERTYNSNNRLFPFDSSTAERMFENVLKKAGFLDENGKGIDDATGRKTIHLHMCRKFFRSQLALNCPVEIVEALMGHEGYLTSSYRKYGDVTKQQAQFFLKSEYNLSIYQGDAEKIKEEFRQEFETKTKEIQKDFSIKQEAQKVAFNEHLKTVIERQEKVIADLSEEVELLKAKEKHKEDVEELTEDDKIAKIALGIRNGEISEDVIYETMKKILADGREKMLNEKIENMRRKK